MSRNGKRSFPAGLTLLELVVVMGILTALAAILVPLMPNLLRRADKATDATQSSELAKAIQLCQATTYGYPDQFDALVDSSGKLPSYLPGSGTTAGVFGGFVQTSPPSGVTMSDAASALSKVGINNVHYLASDTEAGNAYAGGTTTGTAAGFHPTRFPYATSTPTPLSGGSTDIALPQQDERAKRYRQPPAGGRHG